MTYDEAMTIQRGADILLADGKHGVVREASRYNLKVAVHVPGEALLRFVPFDDIEDLRARTGELVQLRSDR